MDYTEVLGQLAPCGLDCGRCVRFKNGDLARAAKTLEKGLQGFGNMVERMAQHNPELKGYSQFEAILNILAKADCIGCRQGSTNCLPTCTIRTCFKKKGVDFCGECTDFPCDQSPFPGPLKQRWIDMNQKIKVIGAESYYEEQFKKPRYGGL
ncbi:MAG TPA: DUF3795 domain-containing protein [Chitinispirillaceae bacterium]|nr:DUF3795 domain-containing protein [Chitinispirillaceae bacterium]